MSTLLQTSSRNCTGARRHAITGNRKGVLVIGVDRSETCDPGCTAPVHGTHNAYQAGCRSDAAREAWRVYSKRRRQGRLEPSTIDATGTRRRLQALAALGWGSTDLAELLGFSHRSRLAQLRQATRVNVRTAAAVRELYDRLSMTVGPSPRARQHALDEGYAPPLAWDDDTIDDPAALPQHTAVAAGGDDWVKVDRACAGEGIELTTSEREHAVRVLHSLRRTDGEIAATLHITARTALRIRQRLTLPPVVPSGREQATQLTGTTS